MSEATNETAATEAQEPKAKRSSKPEGELTQAQAAKAQAAKRTEARKTDVAKLRKLAKEIDRLEDLRTQRNDLIADLVGDGVERSAVQDASGLTVPRFRQVAPPARSTS